jgi:pyridoxine 5-phosphate synthase
MNPLLINSPVNEQRAHTALSVNLNKIALLRNARHLQLPSVLHAAALVWAGGAQGLTVHPRPDERHIRRADVRELAQFLKDWPHIEFNIEGNPLCGVLDIVRLLVDEGLPVHQCTFVPDTVAQFTSDQGWNLSVVADTLAPWVAQTKALGVRVSLFMDPVPGDMSLAHALGADRVELYTERYARAHGSVDEPEVLALFTASAQAAWRCGLGVNAGHDLNINNLGPFLSAVPGVQEVSIGHALVAQALEFGLTTTVRQYVRCIEQVA